jgi:cytochrome c oxidase assembly factor 6
MALFPSSSQQTTTPAPTRSAREACWEHRDVYFGCLDKESVAVPGQEDKDGKCAKEREIYGKECAASWVRLRSPLLLDFPVNFFFKFGRWCGAT